MRAFRQVHDEGEKTRKTSVNLSTCQNRMYLRYGEGHYDQDTKRLVLLHEKVGRLCRMHLISTGSGCHCTRAPAYLPGSNGTAGTYNPQSTEQPASPQSAIASAPETYSSPKRQSSHQLPELSTGIHTTQHGSASDHSRCSSLTPLHQTSRFRPPQSPPGSKSHSSLLIDGDIAAPSERVSADGNQGSHSSSGNRVQYSNGGGLVDSAPEVSKPTFPEATTNNQSHGVHNFNDNQSERPHFASESKCCCGTPKEHKIGREVEQSPRSGAPPHSVETANRRSSMQSSGTNPSNIMKEPNSDIPYSHVPPSFQIPHMPYTNVYNMPSTYATAENPLTQRQQAFFQQNGYMHPHLASYYPPLGAIAPLTVSTSVTGVTHTCTCGPSCQCMFCLAHPYNATTRDRVQTLAHLLPDEPEYSPKSPLQSSFFHSIDDPPRAVAGNNAMHINEILQPPDLTPAIPFHEPSFSNATYEALPVESVHPAPPSAISSGYLTMEYEYDPIGLRECTNSMGTCQCGDGCSCVGCLTHSGHDGEHF